MEPLQLDGKVVLVTGGGRGIGRGIASAFLAAGAHVVIAGRHPVPSLPSSSEYASPPAPSARATPALSTARPADPAPPASDPAPPASARPADLPPSASDRRASFVSADVRDLEQLDRLIAEVIERHGRLDVLINNAGGSPPADAATASPRFSAAIVQLNLIAPLWLAQRANAVMQTQPGGGAIINIASISGTRPSPGTAAYGAAKAGLLNLTQSLAVEWAPRVRVNAIVAGPIRTEQAHLHYGDDAGIAAVDATIPLGRMGTPADVASSCLFLASPLAAWISGAALTVHGGGERPAFLAASNASHRPGAP